MDGGREIPNDPLRELVASIRAEGKTELAFEASVLEAAAMLRTSALEALRRELKAAGVAVTRWNRDLEVKVREVKFEAIQRRAAEVSRRGVAPGAHGAPGGAPHDHDASGSDGNGTRYEMAPGCTAMETIDRRGDPQRTTLARFSARMIAEVCELDAPEAIPRRVRALSVMCEGDTLSRVVEVPSSAFAAMQWPETMVGARARVSPGRSVREHLRAAIEACSDPPTVRRYRFTGWVNDGRWMYLHAGGAIGADGAVADVEVAPVAPGDMYRFPALPEGEERLHAALALVELLSIEPAHVIVPMVALAFRAAMGPTNATVHVTGELGLGKSHLAALVSSLFGAPLADRFPASWADSSSVNGIARTLATVGDALLPIDDLRVGVGREDAALALFERVTRAHFNRASARKLHRDGTTRNDPPSRCAILSTGEVLPRSSSGSSRVVGVALDARPTPDLEPLTRKARDGVLAAAMAMFIQWYAPRVEGDRDHLAARDREAARGWHLGDGDRAAELLGALAHGFEGLLAFLGPGGLFEAGVLDTNDHAAHAARAEKALRHVLEGHGEHVRAENPARRFCELLGAVLRSGAANVAAIRPLGRLGTPPDPTVWGWREDRRGDDEVWRPTGLRVGYLPAGRSQLWLDPGPAFEAITAAARGEGRPLGVDKDGLGRALRSAGVLAACDPTTPTMTVRVGPECLRVWRLRLESLGFDAEGTAEAPDTGNDAPPVDQG